MSKIIAAALAVVTPALAYAAAPAIQPGKYRIGTTDAKGGSRTVTEDCVSAAEAAAMLRPQASDASCRPSRTLVGGGRFDLASSCASGSATVKGSYTPTSFTMDSTISGRMGATPINLAMHSVGQRIGSCAPDEE